MMEDQIPTMQPSYMEIDSANIPLVCDPEERGTSFGQFISNAPDESLSELGPFKSRDMFLPNFTLRTFEGKMPRDAVFYDQHGKGNGMLGSCIFYKGKIRTSLPGTDRNVVSYNGSQNFKFDPNNEFRHHCKADTELNFIHISWTSQFLNQLLPENEPWAETLKTKIDKKERVIGDHFAAVSLEQDKALSNIFNPTLTGKLGYMMMETSIMQVLLLQLHSLFHKQEAFRQPCINKRDLETMHDVKDYLDKTFLEDHSIPDLARKFCTNTNKLMNLFKKVFGKSVFEYISEQRMNYAHRQLREDGLLVIEVSRNIGYKNPNHFSAAFKKKFGVCPSEFRN